MHRAGLIALSCLVFTSAMAQERQFLNPPALSKPAGYSHVVVAPAAKTIYLSGQIALDKEGRLVGKGDFAAQAEQVFANIDAALKAADSSFADVVKLTIYVTDATQVPALRVVRDKYVDTAHPPASTLVEVRRLVREDLLLEVDATAVVSDTPSRSVASWTPAGVSSDLFESHAAFDPRNGDLYFVRSSKSFSGWRILTSRCEGQRWSTPVPPSFAGRGLEADPWFTPDGSRLYFISSRSNGGMESKDLDIWQVDRTAYGKWGKPLRLPAPVNSGEAEWFPRLAADGWLYFGSNRPGGFGRNDIWRARHDASGKWTVENAGAGINTAGDEYEALPSPDGSHLILKADGGLYESTWTGTAWSARVKLGSDINLNGTEIGPVFSPSGKSLLFARDTGEAASGEFLVWHREGREAWPAQCGTKAL